MYRVLSLSSIFLVLLIFACGPSEENTQTTKEKVVEKAKETAQAVADKAAEIEKQVEPKLQEAKEQAKELADQAAEASKEMATEAKEATQKAAEATTEKARSAAIATTMAADKAVESAKQALSPEMLVLEASYGNINFPHAKHSESYDCAICHGEGTPGAFGLTKDVAHKLCKDCHKAEGAPNGCKDCHQK